MLILISVKSRIKKLEIFQAWLLVDKIDVCSSFKGIYCKNNDIFFYFNKIIGILVKSFQSYFRRIFIWKSSMFSRLSRSLSVYFIWKMKSPKLGRPEVTRLAGHIWKHFYDIETANGLPDHPGERKMFRLEKS